jgi:hypothetical protein
METSNTGILVGLLTEEQKNQLVGQQFSPDCYFNPIQDANDNWIISIEEIEASDIQWLKQIEFIEYIPVLLPEINPKPEAEDLSAEEL